MPPDIASTAGRIGHTHSIRPTAAGELLLGEGRRLMAQAERVVDVVRRAGLGQLGSVTVAAIGSATYDVIPRLLREQIASAVDLVVHLARLRDGSRQVALISEVQGMEGDTIVLSPIFHRDGPRGLAPTGLAPTLLQRLADNDQHVDPAIFNA